jgi:hypothetical protein
MPNASIHIALNRLRDATERRIDRLAELDERLAQQVERVEKERAERERVARETRKRLPR